MKQARSTNEPDARRGPTGTHYRSIQDTLGLPPSCGAREVCHRHLLRRHAVTRLSLIAGRLFRRLPQDLDTLAESIVDIEAPDCDIEHDRKWKAEQQTEGAQ